MVLPRIQPDDKFRTPEAIFLIFRRTEKTDTLRKVFYRYEKGRLPVQAFFRATSSLLRSLMWAISSLIMASTLAVPSASGTRSFMPR